MQKWRYRAIMLHDSCIRVRAGAAAIAVHTVTTSSLHVTASCWRASGASPDAHEGMRSTAVCAMHMHLHVQELKASAACSFSTVSTYQADSTAKVTAPSQAGQPAANAAAAAAATSGNVQLLPSKRARDGCEQLGASLLAAAPAAEGTDCAQDACAGCKTRAQVGGAARAEAGEAHVCVTMHAQAVRHVATLGEWLVVNQQGGKLAIWTLACAVPSHVQAQSTLAPGANALCTVEAKDADTANASGRGFEDNAQGVQVRGGEAVEWQQVAGWQFDGVSDVAQLRLQAVPSACGTSRCLHVLLLLPDGRALSVVTPLPV